MRTFERRMVAILTARDPGAALQAAAADRTLPAELRHAFACAYPDGVRLAALLMARLRFERLLRACPEAAAEFDADPGTFAARFRHYHAEVPPTAFFPSAEAALYRSWLSARGSPTPRGSRRPSPSPARPRSGQAAPPSPSGRGKSVDRPPRAR